MVNPTPRKSNFMQFLKYDMTSQSKSNFMPVIIKALLESGLGYWKKTKRPYMKYPPILSAEEMYTILTEAQQDMGPGWKFDAKEAVESVRVFMKDFVSVGSGFGLTLEFSASEIPEMLNICEDAINQSKRR